MEFGPKLKFFNVIMLGICFLLIFTGFQTCGMVEVSVLHSICLLCLHIFFPIVDCSVSVTAVFLEQLKAVLPSKPVFLFRGGRASPGRHQ